MRVTALSSVGAAQTSLTTITIGGADVVSEVVLDGPTAIAGSANEFNIGFQTGNHSEITGDTNEIVELKTNVSTSSNIIYVYEFGA